MKLSECTVSVVIPNYNGLSLLKENIPHIVNALENKKNKIIEIIVVDDASNDDSVAFLKKNYQDKVKVIRHKKNRRFSAAVNTGARTAKGKLICLLNSDVTPTPTFLEKAVTHFKDENVFGVSLKERGYSWSRGYFEDGFFLHKPGKKIEKPHATFWISGGSGLFRRSMWMKLKGMDEVLYPPFYWEDIDLSYRAMKRGWKLIWEPDSLVKHEHESTNKLFKNTYKSRIQERNQLLFMWKNITSASLTRRHMQGIVKRISKHPGYTRILLMAFIKLPQVIKLRKIEKKESTVSDESILSKF